MPSASKQQHWTIYAHLGYDSRETSMTYEQASEVISRSMAGDVPGAISLLESYGAIKKKEIAAKKEKPQAEGKHSYAEIRQEAIRAGDEAVKNTTPTPMIVEQHKNILDDNSPVTKTWTAQFGSCGMAWMYLDGRTGFAKYLVKIGRGHKGEKGVRVEDAPKLSGPAVQSYELNRAYVVAYAEVLRKYGIYPDLYIRED